MRPPHESPEYRYEAFSGVLIQQDGERCCCPVFKPEDWQVRGPLRATQCSRLRGHGYNGLYCKQHAKRWPEDYKP